MRTCKLYFPLPLLTAVAVALSLPATSVAAFQHVVAPGESLSSVAAADGLSVTQLAAANGISADSQLIAGSSLAIPSQSAAPSSVTSEAGNASGSYVVAPGDTLSAIASRYGTTVAQLASINGLDPAGFLLSGSTISVSGGLTEVADAGATAAASSSPPATPTSAVAAPTSTGAQPTPESVSAAEVGSIAAQNGVSPSLAEAIGYQESGFNNGLVSSTGATGVMQIEPGTWNYIGQNLAPPPPLSPSSAADNIRGGVLLLHSLLAQTGGDPAIAAAGYYQGLQSVRAHGMYADTQQYVNNVMALRRRFGGG